jgi:hypothetical protein
MLSCSVRVGAVKTIEASERSQNGGDEHRRRKRVAIDDMNAWR